MSSPFDLSSPCIRITIDVDRCHYIEHHFQRSHYWQIIRRLNVQHPVLEIAINCGDVGGNQFFDAEARLAAPPCGTTSFGWK